MKAFGKNSHFENMRADFLRQCQNWLQQTSPEMMHFQEWQKNILTVIMSLLLILLGFRHTKQLKMAVQISGLWKIHKYLAKRMAINGHKMAIYEP